MKRLIAFLACFIPFISFAQVPEEIANQPYFKYDSATVKPGFPGGTQALNAYIDTSLHYPEMALSDSTEGDVKVWFIVEKTGELSNIRIMESPGNGCDIETERIIRAMPDWVPGKYQGWDVAVEMTLTIRFEL